MKFIHKLMLGSKTKLALSTVGVLALVLFTSVLVVEATKSEVVIVVDGKEQVVATNEKTVEDLLSTIGMEIGAYDELSHELDAPIENGMTINYKTAKEITVTIDDTTENYYTTADTISGFFKEHDLSFSEQDEISHATDKKIEDGLEIMVHKAFEVTISDGGSETVVETTGGTVEELLEVQGINLDEQDKVEPELEEVLNEETAINIVRVTSDIVEKEETLPFKTVEKKDDSLLEGKKNVITQGEDGQVVKKYKVIQENGEEVSRELVDEKIVKERTNRVVAVGTKERVEPDKTENDSNLVTLSNESKKEVSNEQTLTMTASAFSASCDGCSGVTATGINLSANPNQKVIAVDPNVIPLGSKVWVEGYGEAVAGDTGGAIRGNRIDVHVPDATAANQWGVKTVQVKVLD